MLGDVAAQIIIKHIPLGLTRVDQPSTAGVFPHPDNVHAFVTVRNDDSLLVLNLETGGSGADFTGTQIKTTKPAAVIGRPSRRR